MTREETVRTASEIMFEGEIVASFEGVDVLEVAGMFAVHDDFSESPEFPKCFGRFIDAYREAIRIADRVAIQLLPRIVAGRIARKQFEVIQDEIATEEFLRSMAEVMAQ